MPRTKAPAEDQVRAGAPSSQSVDPRPVAEIDLLPVMLLLVQHCEPGLVGMVGMAGINGHIPWCRHPTESANFNYKLLCAIMHCCCCCFCWKSVFKLLLLLHFHFAQVLRHTQAEPHVF